eukprot:CAMPEP_0204042058 /NCGR_PEP_ID=MMETSP0360-20130528/96793_1 /ASSEMBLY_ACC=CAM_ASM_000342 /TAXON_ID=268821 /ORGANISM="Scrippsiella Hangoei, Strain SHTV-5" /LENGTH=41 /DNA_ID= /DNA_START= /DNA_END= /DNA_ORIENTATION=
MAPTCGLGHTLPHFAEPQRGRLTCEKHHRNGAQDVQVTQEP